MYSNIIKTLSVLFLGLSLGVACKKSDSSKSNQGNGNAGTTGTTGTTDTTT